MQIYYRIGLNGYGKEADGSLSILEIENASVFEGFIKFLEAEVSDLLTEPIKYALCIHYQATTVNMPRFSSMTRIVPSTLLDFKLILKRLIQLYPAYAEGGDPSGGDAIANDIARLRWLVERCESALEIGAARGENVRLRIVS